MNPVDHPHGGGEGKSSGGRHPVTPWGVPTKGYKTRDTKKASDTDSKEKKTVSKISVSGRDSIAKVIKKRAIC